jgi:hypothetical protein
MRPLFPLRAGNSAAYTVQRTDGMWRLQWRVLGEQEVEVPAGRFNVWLLEQIEEGMVGNVFRGGRIYYMDKMTGSPVKVQSRVVRGRANLANWEALALGPAS